MGSLLRARLEEIAARQPLVGEVRGLGAMLALELREPTPDAAKATTAAAFEKGLLLLSCGLYGNVIRLLPPLTATDEELERGLEPAGGGTWRRWRRPRLRRSRRRLRPPSA